MHYCEQYYAKGVTKMIQSAEEFIRLRDSEIKHEHNRSAMDEADLSVWLDIIANHPEYRKWVAHNKTVPLSILELLTQYDAETREFVARKRKLSLILFDALSRDKNSNVRIAVAANQKAPINLLEDLATDEDEAVVRAARYNLDRRAPLHPRHSRRSGCTDDNH